MRPALEFDLGTISALNEFRTEASAIQSEINRIVHNAANRDGGIPQWKPCHCFAVAMIMTEKKAVRWIATMSKPEPMYAFSSVVEYVMSHLGDQRGVNISIVPLEG